MPDKYTLWLVAISANLDIYIQEVLFDQKLDQIKQYKKWGISPSKLEEKYISKIFASRGIRYSALVALFELGESEDKLEIAFNETDTYFDWRRCVYESL